MNKNTDTATMELMIGNMNLRISKKTDPLLLAKTIQILTKQSFVWIRLEWCGVEKIIKDREWYLCYT